MDDGFVREEGDNLVWDGKGIATFFLGRGFFEDLRLSRDFGVTVIFGSDLLHVYSLIIHKL